MSMYAVDETYLTGIANAIREKGVEGTFDVSEMENAIRQISGGGLDPKSLADLTFTSPFTAIPLNQVIKTKAENTTVERVTYKTNEIDLEWTGGSSIGFWMWTQMDFTKVNKVTLVYDAIKSYHNERQRRDMIAWDVCMGVADKNSADTSSTFEYHVHDGDYGTDKVLVLDTSATTGIHQLRFTFHGWTLTVKDIIIE